MEREEMLDALDVLMEAIREETLGHIEETCLCRLCVAMRSQRLDGVVALEKFVIRRPRNPCNA